MHWVMEVIKSILRKKENKYGIDQPYYQ